MTISKVLEETSRRILRRDAETLLLHVTGRDRAGLLAHPEAELSPEQIERIQELVVRRETHEPVQYLTGHQEFFGLDLRVTPEVLIPRPETELLVEAVVEWVHSRSAIGRVGQMLVVDVGTGSGAIALALAYALPKARVQGLDLSPAALAVAQGNAERLRLKEQVRFAESNLLELVSGDFAPGSLDIVVSNPPYVPSSDAASLQPEVRDFEPHMALFAGEDGLEVYRRLVPQARQALREGGLLAMEFGFGQREDLRALLEDWRDLRFLDDYGGIPRIVLAERP